MPVRLLPCMACVSPHALALLASFYSTRYPSKAAAFLPSQQPAAEIKARQAFSAFARDSGGVSTTTSKITKVDGIH